MYENIIYDSRWKTGLRFNDMEAAESGDFECMITEDFGSEDKETSINAYVRNVMWYYLTEQMIIDIRNSGLTLNEEEVLIDQISNVELEIPVAISNFYRDRCNLNLIMEEPES